MLGFAKPLCKPHLATELIQMVRESRKKRRIYQFLKYFLGFKLSGRIHSHDLVQKKQKDTLWPNTLCGRIPSKPGRIHSIPGRINSIVPPNTLGAWPDKLGAWPDKL